MKHKDRVRVAFIGAGNIAAQHIRAIRNFSDVKVEDIFDINKKTLLARKSELGVAAYDSLDRLLNSVCPDAIFICIPPYAHGEAELTCIKHRIPFLVEKPLANDLNVANEIAAQVCKSCIITCVAYMNRYRRGVAEAKKLFEKHPPTLINGGWLIDTPTNHPWLTRKHLSGGQLVEQVTHIFDIIRYLCGDVASIYCSGAKGFIPKNELYDTDDATVVSMQMKNGAVVSIQSSWSSGLGNLIYLRFFGPTIRVEFEGWNHDAKIITRSSSLNIKGEENIFAIEDRVFLDAVKMGDPSIILSDYMDGVKSLALSIAANKSLETGKPINF